ncbi:MAG: N-acetyltransferase [Akkermansiaceae bacterium]|nr:N-acetyltransferase [Akkermansiaceae bacterium]
MMVRPARDTELEAIRKVHLAAFGDDERETVACLACELQSKASDPRHLGLVAEEQGVIVGHVMFSPVSVGGDDHILGFILAPLAVSPPRQGAGIGTLLVTEGIRILSGSGADIVFVYGDPAYYGRFGFRRETAEGFTPPHPLTYPDGWLALRTNDARPLPDAAGISCVPPLDRPELW